jgi:hypothetical protein
MAEPTVRLFGAQLDQNPMTSDTPVGFRSIEAVFGSVSAHPAAVSANPASESPWFMRPWASTALLDSGRADRIGHLLRILSDHIGFLACAASVAPLTGSARCRQMDMA